MTHPESSASVARNGSTAFPSTHWSMVLSAGADDEPSARSALEQLCRRYWYPLYSFIRRRGHNHHEAEDLTQAFFCHLLARDNLNRARPERGRFRTFLLSSLRNYMIDDWHRSRAAKRGGGIELSPLELNTAEASFSREPADQGITPEQAFERNWALSLVTQSLDDLRAEYEASGRGGLFEALAPVVWGGAATEKLAVQARQLGLQEGALKVAIHRLRKRLRERLRANIANTVADTADLDDELRYLMTVLSEGSKPL